MSAYVVSWLNDDLELGPLTAVERDCASGWLLAEIISRIHPRLLHPDDLSIQFINDRKKGETRPLPEIKKHNLTQLRPLFRQLGIAVTDETVENIGAADRGTALRILYQLRKTLDVEVPPKPRERIPKIKRKELGAFETYWYGHGGHAEPLCRGDFSTVR